MATSNPRIPQGTLNRLRGSVKFVSNPQLNVTASYLVKDGIEIALEGEATTVIPTMVGVVTSPDPYMIAAVTINILKTNGLAATYKSQMENSTVIGDIVITPDTSALPTYYVNNASIVDVRPMKINGEEAGWSITLRGYYNINNTLWSLL
jgi:hypothetical protein